MSRADTTVIVNWRDLYHPESGGAEIYCEEVARRLAADGRRVVLLTAAVDDRPTTEHHDGYTVVRRGGRFTVYLWALVWLRLHRRRISGVIDSQNGIPFFSPLAVRATTPVVLLMHHVHQQQFGEYFPPLVARFGRWLEGPVSRRVYGSRTVVAVSPSTRRAVRKVLQLQGAIHVAVPGCRPVELTPGGLEGRSSTPRIVCVGRLVRHKRLHLLIEAMPAVLQAHPDAELHVVGDGPDRAAIEAVAAGLGGSVVFHGAVASAERDRLVRSAWLAVNPSVGEGWGISVIEANAQGRPVIAFRVPGLRDSIRDGETGWLVEDGCELGPRLSASLTELADGETAAKWSARTAAWAARADWDETTRLVGNALEGERGRLTAAPRRRPTDLATHVFVPASLVPTDWDPVFRIVDRAVWTTSGLSLLLPGTDLADAVSALRRAGLPASAVADPRLEIRIARPGDLVDPAAGVGLREAARPEPPALTLMGNESGTVS